jgi:hypothetical protein
MAKSGPEWRYDSRVVLCLLLVPYAYRGGAEHAEVARRVSRCLSDFRPLKLTAYDHHGRRVRLTLRAHKRARRTRLFARPAFGGASGDENNHRHKRACEIPRACVCGCSHPLAARSAARTALIERLSARPP